MARPLLIGLVLIASAAALPAPAPAPAPARAGEGEPRDRRLRVMSLNLAVGGEALGKSPEESVAVIRASGAEVVGLQETHGRKVDGGAGVEPDNGKKIAERLGWHFLAQPNRCAILSKKEFPIVRPTRGKQGAVVRVDERTEIVVFNVHLPAAPYQPYLLSGIEYAKGVTMLKTEEEAVRSARLARGKQTDVLVADIRDESAADPNRTTFVTGDFNEPSHLDWTAAAAKAGACPIKVDWPASRAMEALGFLDGYRSVHPGPLEKPGHTWTPTTEPTDKNDRHERIDFVYVRGVAASAIEEALVVGEKPAAADRVITPWPSDHRAVMATARLPGGGGGRVTR